MVTLSLPPPTRTPTAPRKPTQQQEEKARSGGQALVTTTQSHNRSVGNGGPNRVKVPSYEERCRRALEASKLTPEQRKARKISLFVPRSLSDFDDGGAFPEIHVAQYPRHMGNPHLKRGRTATSASGGNDGSGSGGAAPPSSRALINVEIDKDGEVSYDAIVKSGTNSDKIVYSKLEDMKGLQEGGGGGGDDDGIALPSASEEEATKNRTQAALQSLLSSKTALDKPSGSAMVYAATSKDQESKTQFIKYTPRPDAPGYNAATAAQRVIQLVPAQVDPMMPPKHRHLKAPAGPAEDPVPVLHRPPAKLTKEEREAWNIPACISNWKNARGYTIPLDKRLAADGRGLREHSINSNFATLSESLYVAEKQARQEVRMRAQLQKKLALQETQQREEELRKLASQARKERSYYAPSSAATAPVDPTRRAENEEGGATSARGDAGEARLHQGQGDQHRDRQPRPHVSDASSDDDDDDDDSEGGSRRGRGRSSREEKPETDEQVAARQREKLRLERRRERERELRLENSMEYKKRRLEEERDVSEKIALGVHTGHGGGGEDGDVVDSRVYNQSAGLNSGFGATDDEYNTYTKPLFGAAGGSSAGIYRPTRGAESEYNGEEQYQKLLETGTSRFQPDKGFSGAQGGVKSGPRTGPVQFEKHQK